jgi:hypothetical protein
MFLFSYKSLIGCCDLPVYYHSICMCPSMQVITAPPSIPSLNDFCLARVIVEPKKKFDTIRLILSGTAATQAISTRHSSPRPAAALLYVVENTSATMGAEQSSSRHDSAAQDGTAVKTCYYEVLAVDRQATDDE